MGEGDRAGCRLKPKRTHKIICKHISENCIYKLHPAGKNVAAIGVLEKKEWP